MFSKKIAKFCIKSSKWFKWSFCLIEFYQTKTPGIQKVSDRFPEQIEPITIKSPEVEMFKSEYTVLGKISTFGFLIEIALL